MALFEELEQRYNLPSGLLHAVSRVESGGNPKAVSPKGAQGLFQIMPATAKDLGVNPLDPTQAAEGAARYLSQNLKKYGDVKLALAAYNAGPGAVDKYGGVPPFKETQGYVTKVTNRLTTANPAKPPPGFELIDTPTKAQGTPPPPAGFELISTQPPAKPQQYNPTEGMSTGQRLAAGAGKALVDLGRGVKQVATQAGNKVGLVSDQTAADVQTQIDEARALDAPLMATTAGAVGNIAGNVAAFVPTALVPGANTYTGAALVGGALGALQPTAEGESRGLNTAVGVGSGLAGKAIGDKVAKVLGDRLANRTAQLATQQSQNATKDATVAAAREAGYVIPPSQANPSLANRALEGFSGKIQTAQAASVKNQEVTNKLAKKALGLAEDAPLTKETLRGVRAQAGKAYDAVAKYANKFVPDEQFSAEVQSLGKGYSDFVKEFPELGTEGVDKVIQALSKNEFSPKGAIEAIKSLRYNGQGNLASAARTADPAKKILGNAQIEAADALESLAERNLQQSGKGNLVKEFRKARTLIAKTYTVENALNESTSNVAAQKLGGALRKGKYLSGELKTAGQFSQAFPKAAQEITSSTPGVSPLDYAVGGLSTAASGNVAALAGIGARPAVRSVLLSDLYQRMATQAPSYAPGLGVTLPARIANNPMVNRLAPLLATDVVLQNR
jgi:hypothetical protein